jgi:LuxR family transcriptional regulator, maltose regulon positive regulatory protein
MTQLLLQSKLHVPGTRSGTLSRERLLTQLDDALYNEHRLILVCAPAGAGKTTLLCDWITQSGLLCAWVTLDEEDNNPARFAQYVIAAISRTLVSIGTSLDENFEPELETLWEEFVNALPQLDEPLLIMLDDYHLIQHEAVHAGIVFLIEHLPPHVRLVLATRSDPPLPVARLRVRHQITEIREQDIHFTSPETHDFLNIASGLTIDDRGVDALHERTEGWIAGLQLAALSLRRYADPTEFIDQFTGSHRFVLDYLTEEVLNQQSTEIQAFLLKTSILDRLNPELCQAVTGDLDSHCILEMLYRENMFLIPLDAAGITFRYHHLFRDLLRVRLRQNYADQIPDLHQRAAAWYADHDDELLELGHFLAREQHQQAAELVGQEAFTPYNRGNILALVSLIRGLPPARQRPWLKAYNGMFLAISGQAEAGESALCLAEQEQNDPALIAFIAATRVQMLCAQLCIYRAKEQAQIALDTMSPDYPFIITYAQYGMGKVWMALGELERGQEVFQQALDLSERNNHIVHIIPVASYLAQIALLLQDLDTADAILYKAQHYTEQYHTQASHMEPFWQVVRAYWLYKSGQIDKALVLAEKTTESCLKHHNIYTAIQAYLVQSHTLDALNRPDDAVGAITAARELFQQYPIFLDLREMTRLQEARHALHVGDLKSAAESLRMCDPGESILLERQKQELMAQCAVLQSSDTRVTYHADLIEQLSRREIEVLQLIAEGLSNQEIAEQLVVSLSTVKKHSSSIYGKLGVRSRTQAVTRAQKLGLLS